jgi:UDP-N-acetylglucosamine:LPS N-acetylglucosamine transferase
MSNKFLSRFCKTVFVAFKETEDRGDFTNKAIYVGNPTRESVLKKDKGLPMNMLHVEAYEPDYIGEGEIWNLNSKVNIW